MGPELVGSGKRLSVSLSRCLARRRFNGAGAGWLRKTRQRPRRNQKEIGASMGPELVGSGKPFYLWVVQNTT